MQHKSQPEGWQLFLLCVQTTYTTYRTFSRVLIKMLGWIPAVRVVYEGRPKASIRETQIVKELTVVESRATVVT